MPILSSMTIEEYAASLAAYCNPSPQAAQFNKGPDMTAQEYLIPNVPIFKTGRHKEGDKHFTTDDLDAIVATHPHLDFQPALTIGHPDDPGAAAFGYVQRLRRVGEMLVADLTTAHKAVYDAIKTRMYDRVSAELYFNLKRAGRLFPMALCSVGLLGANVPGVAGLVPLHKVQVFGEEEQNSHAAIERYEQPVSAADSPRSAGDEVDRRVAAYREQHTGTSYSDALRSVLATDPALHRSYGDVFPVSPRAEAGMTIDTRVRAILNANPELNYDDVLRQVLEQNPELAQAYAGTPDLRFG
jgi:hypothetical protein